MYVSVKSKHVTAMYRRNRKVKKIFAVGSSPLSTTYWKIRRKWQCQYLSDVMHETEITYISTLPFRYFEFAVTGMFHLKIKDSKQNFNSLQEVQFKSEN